MTDELAFMQRFYDEIWTHGNVARIDEWVSADCVIHGLGVPMRGRAPFHDFHAAFDVGFRDIRIVIEEHPVDGDRMALRATFTAVQKRTGKPITITGGGMCRVRDGQVIEAWNAWGFLGLAQQVGVVPADTLIRTFTS